jgi:hypothetical protein
MLGHTEKTTMKQRRVHETVYGRRNKRQLARQSKFRGSVWYDSTSNDARWHALHPDLNASIIIQKYLMDSGRRAAFCRANFRDRRFVLWAGNVLRDLRIPLEK